MRNKRRVTALAVVAAAAIIAAGGLMASNMGFKLNYPLQASSPGVSASGFQTIGLPYNRQVGIDTASQLLADISAGGVNALQLQKFNPAVDTLDPYPGGADFTLTASEGYFLQVGTTGSYIIVGSHDPGYSVTLQAASPGLSASGFQIYAHPYHGVSATASQFLTETGAGQIQKFNPVLDTLDPYPGGADFSLVPGEAYFVQTNATTSFVPAHY
jgi:hypothetical protein